MSLQRVTGAQIAKAYASSDLEFQIGAEYEDEMGRVYYYGQYKDLGQYGQSAAGLMAVGCDGGYNYGQVTCDSDNANANPEDPVGQCQVILTDDQCGFFQRTGRNRLAATTNGAVNQGNEVVVSSLTRGILIPKATYRMTVGVARNGDGATTTLEPGQLALRIAQR